MPRQDTLDFLAAFAVGTALGVGATLLLKPQPDRRERLARSLKPYGKQLRKSYRTLSRGVREGSDATSGMTTELVGVGRELLGEFRDEVAEILSDARSELQSLAKEQSQTIEKSTRRARRKVGL